MPIPKPKPDEMRADFMARCMGDTMMNSDYPDNSQRAAVCNSQWRDMHGGKAMDNSMRHVRIKAEDGSLHDQDMSSEELHEWFSENTKDGAVLADITLFTDVTIKAVDGESADWVLSDMSLDRDMERVDPNGADFKRYKQNPVVLWAHDYTRPAIGKMESPKVKDGQVVGKIHFDTRENDPFAYSIGQKVKSGIISAGSVGFKPSKVEFVEDSKDPTRMIHRNWELMEFSICNVPSNYNALAAREAPPADDKMEALDKRVKELEDSIGKKKTYVSDLFSGTGKTSPATTEAKSETDAISALFGARTPSEHVEPDAFTSLGDNK